LIDWAGLRLEDYVPDLLLKSVICTWTGDESLAFSFSLMRGDSTSFLAGFGKNGGKKVRQISDEYP
jgi:hypothetical protein